MMLETVQAQNVLKWNCQYEGVKLIAVQRSSDSVRNFVTVGILNKPAKGVQTYTDVRPLAGKNYYRLSILFSGDLEWFSNTYKVYLDSAVLAKSLEGTVISGSTNANTNYSSNLPNGVSPKATEFYYTPSTQVYSNPYTGHITIQLPDALSRKYSIRFFTPDEKEVLRVGRVSKTTLIVDKNNFNSRGVYQFKLFDGEELKEAGYVTIY